MRKITLHTLCIVSMQLFLISESVFATNYYVDSKSGNDGNDGSQATPWKTIDRVNMATFVAGDTVFFKRGGAFRGTLMPKSGTTSGNITYSAYGTGTTDKPKLLASFQRNNTTDWTNEGGNLWSTTHKAATLSGTELLLNPSFATNTSNWNFYYNSSVTPAISATLTRTTVANEYYDAIGGGGKVTCVNNGNTTSDIQLSTHGFDIKAATWYKLTLKARASAGFTAPIQFMKNGSPYTNYILSSTASSLAFTTSWTSYEVYIQSNYTTVVSNSTDKARLTIQLGNVLPDGGSLYVDAFSLQECLTPPEYLSEDIGNIILGNLTGVEKLSNPSFLTSTSNWNFYYNSGIVPSLAATLTRSTTENEFFDAAGGAKITCAYNGNTAGDIQFYTEGFDIVSTKWYKLTFKARATGSFNAPIQMLKHGSPYTNYCSSSSTSSIQFKSGDWRSYEVYFQSNYTTDIYNSADKARITIQLGNAIPDGGAVFLDDFSLRECKATPLYTLGDGLKNFIQGDEGACGVKVWNQSDLNVNGEYWFDTSTNKLYFYTSEGNPASVYSNIELATKKMNISAVAKSYLTIENLDLRYGGGGGINFEGYGDGANYVYPQSVNFKGLDISFVGGAKLSGTTRAGNGIGFWNGARNITVESCRISQVYDSGISPQGSLNGHACQDMYFRNNILDKCEQSYEMWQSGTSSLSNIYFENNTCANSGYGWSHGQRPDPRGVHLLFWGFASTVTVSNIQIRNNIFLKSIDYGIYSHWSDDINKVVINYSCWYPGTSIPLLRVNYPSVTSYDWATYRSTFGDDSNSLLSNPLINADGTLASGSPCINSGQTLSTTTYDFYYGSRPQGAAFDIGAFEYGTTPNPAPAIRRDFNLNVSDNVLSVIVYPNPTTNFLFVKFENLSKTTVNLILMSLDGKIVQTENVSDTISGLYRMELNQNMKKGLYFLKINSENDSKVFTIVIK